MDIEAPDCLSIWAKHLLLLAYNCVYSNIQNIKALKYLGTWPNIIKIYIYFVLELKYRTVRKYKERQTPKSLFSTHEYIIMIIKGIIIIIVITWRGWVTHRGYATWRCSAVPLQWTALDPGNSN